jgi:hypothetical protein
MLEALLQHRAVARTAWRRRPARHDKQRVQHGGDPGDRRPSEAGHRQLRGGRRGRHVDIAHSKQRGRNPHVQHRGQGGAQQRRIERHARKRRAPLPRSRCIRSYVRCSGRVPQAIQQAARGERPRRVYGKPRRGAYERRRSTRPRGGAMAAAASHDTRLGL